MTEYTRLEESNFLNWDCLVKVDKYSLDQVRWVKRKTGLTNPSAEVLRETLKSLPSETAYGRGNLITTVGLGYLWSSITGVTTTVVAHQLSYSFLPVGVGDGNGSVPTAAVGDVDLTAATNKYYVPVDASYPQVGSGVSAGVLTVQATFGTSVANFAWNEWGFFGTTAPFTSSQATTPSNSYMINHKGVSLGTKTGSNIWVLSATITLS